MQIAQESNKNVRGLDAKTACEYIGMGRSRGTVFLREIGAERKIGKRCIYDRAVIDSWFDNNQKGE